MTQITIIYVLQVSINQKKDYNIYMKLNPVRAIIITSIAIILLYCLGLFLPIILNTKDSNLIIFQEEKLTFLLKKKITSL